MRDSNYLAAHNARHTFHPMGHPAEIQAHPPRIIASGSGVRVTDSNGFEVVDAVGGLWNVNLGYSCDPIKQAIAEQLESLPYYAAFRGTTTPSLIELSERLTTILEPEGMTRAFFTSGGSDSIESALRIARQYWKATGARDRFKFLSFKKGYHGTHFGGASVNGGIRFRRNYEPMLPGCFHVPFPETYRNSFGMSDAEELTRTCLNLIEEEITFQGPDTIAAFIAEPVLGAGGVFVPHPSLWPGLRALCDKYGILLIADEVVTGFGRTGAWFGARKWGVKPDIMCLAKAITSGYFPFGAVMLSARIERGFMENDDSFGALYHGYTYTGHPVGCAAALAALDVTFAQDLPGNAVAQGDHIRSELETLAGETSTIGDVRGIGLMIAVEVVDDREAKTPADADMMSRLADVAYENGALIRVSGNVMILSPPLILSRAEARVIVEALSAAFHDLESRR